MRPSRRRSAYGVGEEPRMPGKSDIILECLDVSVGYAERPILHHVNIQIGQREIVALLGASGCGKSTLLRTLCGLLPPLTGDVRLFGQSLYELDDDERRALVQRVGFAFQNDA